jgi:hypothetical protein
MILQFPVGDLRARPGWGPGAVVEEAAFGPRAAGGHSEQLRLAFSGLTADLVAPFDGYLRRLLPAGGDPTTPAVLEIQPRLATATLGLAEGLDGLGGQLPAERAGLLPRLRWLEVDPALAAAALGPRIDAQVTATEPTQQVEARERFMAGEYSLFLERGAVLAAGVGRAVLELRTRDGVVVDPVAYYAYYHDRAPGPEGEVLADRDWLGELLGRLTRRALVQLVDEHGRPLA